MAVKKNLALGDTFMQGKNKYSVIGFDAAGRPISTMITGEERPVRRSRSKEESKVGEE